MRGNLTLTIKIHYPKITDKDTLSKNDRLRTGVYDTIQSFQEFNILQRICKKCFISKQRLINTNAQQKLYVQNYLDVGVRRELQYGNDLIRKKIEGKQKQKTTKFPKR